MFFAKLALRNVLRRYGRTTLSMVSIVAGVMVLIVGRAFIGGSKENIIRAQIDSVSGHVVVTPAGYPEGGVRHPVDTLIRLEPSTAAWLKANSQAWTLRTLFVPRAVNGVDALRVRAFGFDPATDAAVFPRRDWRIRGETPTDGVLVSVGVGRILDVEPGDALVFETRTTAGALNALRLRVQGVLRTGNPTIDRVGVFVPRAVQQQLIRSEERFSHLAVRLEDRNEAETVANELRRRFGESARVRTWQQETEGMIELQDLRQGILDVIALVLMAIAATGIANTVLMAAYERVREIGTLRAMGLTRLGVVGLFVAEGVVMGAVGSAVGALGGALLVKRWAARGIDLSPLVDSAGSTGAYDSIPFSAMLYLEYSTPTVLGAALFGLTVAVLASVYPAIVASSMPPAEAVRSA